MLECDSLPGFSMAACCVLFRVCARCFVFFPFYCFMAACSKAWCRSCAWFSHVVMRYRADVRACSSCGLKMDGTPPPTLFISPLAIHPSIRPSVRASKGCVWGWGWGGGMMRGGVGEGDEGRGGFADAKIGAAPALTELFYVLRDIGAP